MEGCQVDEQGQDLVVHQEEGKEKNAWRSEVMIDDSGSEREVCTG